MDLNHEFTVPVPVEDAWKILTDVERIAPCLPGAKLEDITDDTYSGFVKVKVGPIQAQFKGQASFVELNESAHKVVLKGEGRDTTGKGNAAALITAQLVSETPTSTKVTVHTDLNITGKVAQFGRGAMADISNKLLDQFVDLASGTESRCGENFVDPLHRWFSIGLIGWFGIRSVFLLQILFLGGFCWASFSR